MGVFRYNEVHSGEEIVVLEKGADFIVVFYEFSFLFFRENVNYIHLILIVYLFFLKVILFTLGSLMLNILSI